MIQISNYEYKRYYKILTDVTKTVKKNVRRRIAKSKKKQKLHGKL